MEYGFQDDGVITFPRRLDRPQLWRRLGTGHMHNSLWRINVNLDGPDHNSVLLMEHNEPYSQDPKERAKARTVHTPFNGGKEGYADWDPEEVHHAPRHHERRQERSR